MKALKEKKGFTLIELLAVIVVLAIVMVLATTTVLPYMTKATQNSFAIEANAAVDAASQAMSLIQIDSISDADLIDSSKYSTASTKDANTNVTTTTYCFTLEKLVELGLWKKDIDEVKTGTGLTPKYEGTVVVTTNSNSKVYTYSIEMTNGDLYVKQASGSVDGETDVLNYDAEKVTLKTTCG